MHKMKKLHSLGVKKHSNEFAVHGGDVLVSESLNQKINAVYQSLIYPTTLSMNQLTRLVYTSLKRLIL